jgi:hypothetical protein
MKRSGPITSSVSNRKPQVIRSESFERKAKTIRKLFVDQFGRMESVLEVGGKVIGNTVFCTDCLIPMARVGFTHFNVEDRDLSKCWNDAEQNDATKHLLPVADLHYHPGESRPSSSSIDEENSLRQASLYHPFNLQVFKMIKKLNQHTLLSRDGSASFQIDDSRRVSVPLNESHRLRPSILYEERIKRSLWGSLIYPSNASSDLMAAYVVEHKYVSADETIVKRHEDVKTCVLSDEEISQHTGWSIEKIRLQVDKKALEKEVARKYQTYTSQWTTYQNNYPACRHGELYEVNICQRVPGARCYANCPVAFDQNQTQSNFQFLAQNSNRRDVAHLLKEIAAIIDSEPIEAFYFLERDITNKEMVTALNECVRILQQVSKLH